MRISIAILVGALAFAGLASPALAGTINTNRPIALGDNLFEDNLQEVLDGIHVGGPAIDAVADQTGFALFHNQASGGAVATFIVEITSGSASQVLGLYDAYDPTNRIPIFGGADTTGEQKLISFLLNGTVKINGVVAGALTGGSFGFYLANGSTVWYTEDELNGGNPQALVYRGNGLTTLQLPGFAPGVFATDEYIFAFEDGAYRASDQDFQDAVFLVESISPMPEPGTLALLGVAGVGALLRRRKRASA